MQNLANNCFSFIREKQYPIKIFLILSWASWLVNVATEQGAFPSTYLVLGFLGIFALSRVEKESVLTNKYEKIWIAGASILLSLAVIMANYGALSYSDSFAKKLIGIFFVFLFFIAGYCAAEAMLKWLLFSISCKHEKFSSDAGKNSRKVFWLSFAVICVIDLVILFAAFYPGVLTRDSSWQVQQVMEGNYSNHHPFYHTMLIKLFMDLGMSLSGNINVGVCFYSVFQIVSMAAIFAYTIMTVYQVCKSKIWAWGCFIWYAFYPIHVMYSFTMWKDVLFGGMMLLFITALYRALAGVGKHRWLNLGLAFLSALGICLLRSNGLFAFTIFFVFFSLFYLKKYTKLMIGFAAVIAASIVLKGPVLETLHVEQPDTIESLSIPAQQIARVLHEGNSLTEEQRAVLSNVIDVDRAATTYADYISDPIKDLVRETGDQEYITEHKFELLKLWVEIGLQYPGEYIAAWIDQTVGYWNGGYEYWTFAYDVYENEYGIEKSVHSGFIQSLWNGYAYMFQDPPRFPVLNVFVSIGMFTWCIFGIFIASMSQKQWEKAVLTVPALAVILSLMAATPVASEFRYAYSSVTCIPLILAVFWIGFPKKSLQNTDFSVK